MIDVRERTDADLPAAVAVLRQVHEQDHYPVHWQEPADRWLTPPKTETAWVAVEGDALLGHALVEADDDGLTLARLFVAPAARGRGVTDLLLDVVEEHARAAASRLRLQVHESAAPAIAAYERRGWIRTGSHDASWFEADGVTRARAIAYTAPNRGSVSIR